MSLVVIGLDSDKTTRHFATSAMGGGRELPRFVNLREVCAHPWSITLDGCRSACRVYVGTPDEVVLTATDDYFVRLVDISSALDDEVASRWRHMLQGFSAFLEVCKGKVVNRPNSHSHNGSKPYHEHWLASAGFDVPASMVSSDPKRLREFARRQERVILKAVSGRRGTAELLTSERLGDYRSEAGPILLQEYVEGYDVRAHVVDTQVITERIDSHQVDYRAPGADCEHRLVDAPDSLAVAMVAATARMNLVFAGWDFKVSADGRWRCLEANPMPGFDSYDRRANGAISAALLSYFDLR